MPEYLKFRCCMCPNISKPTTAICPAFMGRPETPCRFVKQYVDDRGWKYKVMGGISENRFKARYQRPEKRENVGWKGLAAVSWRDTFDKAQADLNAYAEKKGWQEI